MDEIIGLNIREISNVLVLVASILAAGNLLQDAT